MCVCIQGDLRLTLHFLTSRCSAGGNSATLEVTQEVCITARPVCEVPVLLHGQGKVLQSLTGLRGAAERCRMLKAIHAELCQCNSVGLAVLCPLGLHMVPAARFKVLEGFLFFISARRGTMSLGCRARSHEGHISGTPRGEFHNIWRKRPLLLKDELSRFWRSKVIASIQNMFLARTQGFIH